MTASTAAWNRPGTIESFFVTNAAVADKTPAASKDAIMLFVTGKEPRWKTGSAASEIFMNSYREVLVDLNRG